MNAEVQTWMRADCAEQLVNAARKRGRRGVFAAAVLLGLSALPGCGLHSMLQPEPEHVYSTTAPVPIGQPSGVRPAGLTETAAYPDQTAVSGQRGPVFATGIQQTARQPAASGSAPAPRLIAAQLGPMETVSTSPLADVYPDEYLFDGGDREAAAALNAAPYSGLDSEDTVAAWVSASGEQQRTVSNRVAVYAPRFGSVRRLAGLTSETQIQRAVGTRDAAAVGRLRGDQGVTENTSQTALVAMEFRNRADEMLNADTAAGSNGSTRLEQSAKVDAGQEGRATTSSSSFLRRDGPETAAALSNAAAWSRKDFPMVSLATDSAAQLRDVIKLQETIGLEDQNHEGVLKLVKLADVGEAHRGEIVQFTIRFQNTGDVELRDVRIVDNLTPRLEYVDGSAVINGDVNGFVTATPNGEGSVVLTFEFSEPLPGHAAGEISFQAMVR